MHTGMACSIALLREMRSQVSSKRGTRSTHPEPWASEKPARSTAPTVAHPSASGCHLLRQGHELTYIRSANERPKAVPCIFQARFPTAQQLRWQSHGLDCTNTRTSSPSCLLHHDHAHPVHCAPIVLPTGTPQPQLFPRCLACTTVTLLHLPFSSNIRYQPLQFHPQVRSLGTYLQYQ